MTADPKTADPSPAQLAARIDHTLLKPEARPADIDRLTAEALEHGFASVCVNPVFAQRAAQALAGSKVKTCCVAGFPLGAGKPTVKAIEATAACKDGAREIDFVAHLPALLARDEQAAVIAFRELVAAVRGVSREVVVKVIVESAALMAGVSGDEGEARIAVACRAAVASGCDFIKTSTGFHPAGGATVEAVRLMKRHAEAAGGGLKVKASGGIRTYDDATAMLKAGADRLGCSAGVAIVAGGSEGAGNQADEGDY